MNLIETLETLSQYGKHRSPDFKARREELAAAAVANFRKGDFNTFCWLYDKAFALLWQQMHDYRDTQYEIRETLIEPARKLFAPEPLRKKGRIKRVAYLSAQTTVSGPYANGRTLYSFAKGHSGAFEMYWYNYGAGEPQVVSNLEAMGYTFRNFGGTPLEKAAAIREACVADEIDVLISDMYWAIPLALFEMRTAPYQLYLSMGFQKFPADRVLLMNTMEPFDEDVEQIPYTISREFLYQEDKPLFKRPGITLGTHCRREKCSPEFMATVREILELRPGVHYATHGRGTLHNTHPRISVLEADSPHRILPTFDIWLDTFPLCGCMASFEAQAHGIPTLTWSHPSTASYDKFKGKIVDSREAYIAEAVKMIDNSDHRREVAALGQSKLDLITDTRAGASAIEDVLWRLQITPN